MDDNIMGDFYAAMDRHRVVVEIHRRHHSDAWTATLTYESGSHHRDDGSVGFINPYYHRIMNEIVEFVLRLDG